MKPNSTQIASLLRQGWVWLAIWIVFGIVIEGLIGFRSPALLDDLIRKEMFRLAHAHGTLLNVVLIVAAICVRLELIRIQAIAALGLRAAALLLPLGFLLGGLWHFKDDPGIGIFLVPIGAVLLLVSAISIALSARNTSEKLRH
jgi:hypothetical protein